MREPEVGFVPTGRDLKDIAKGLRGADNKEIRKQFSRQLREAAKPMVPAVRRSIKAIPSKTGNRKGLRARMSKAVKLEVKTSGRQAQVSLRVDGRKMPNKEGSLPAYMDGRKSPWRHPVFGQDQWVAQRPHPFFERATASLGAQSQAKVQKAVRDIKKQIE